MARLALTAAVVLTSGCAHLAPECASHGGSPWVEIRSARFVVKSNLPAADAEAAALELEYTLAALNRAMRQSVPRAGARIEAVLLRQPEEVQWVAGHAIIRGFMRHDWRGPIAVIAWQRSTLFDDDGLATLKHELTHLVAARNLGPQPRWVAEGLARYFETLTVDPRRKLVRSGQLNDDALADVRAGLLLKLETLWRWRGQLAPEMEQAAYASSWVWVHFLFNHHRAPWLKFLRALGHDEPRKAFAAAFEGIDGAALEAGLRRYVELGSYRESTTPLPAVDTTLERRGLPDSAVHALFARLAPAPASRQQEIEKALQLDAGEAAALEEQVHAEVVAATKLALAQKLTALPGATATSFRLLAEALDARVERVAALERAVELEPDDAEAHRMLARALAGHEIERALVHAARAVELAPQLQRVWFLKSEVLAQAGQCAEAAAAMRRGLGLPRHDARRSSAAAPGLARLKKRCGVELEE